MQYIASHYTHFDVDLSTNLNFFGLITLVAFKTKLHTSQIRLSSLHAIMKNGAQNQIHLNTSIRQYLPTRNVM